MRFWVGAADNQWFKYLAEARPDEVNFSRPTPNHPWRWASGSWMWPGTRSTAGHTPSTAWDIVAARRFQDHRTLHPASTAP
jgi:hypothetical protein